jgi:hypothetical protein
MAQVAQMTKKDVGYMLATVSLNQPLHPEVRPYMLLNSEIRHTYAIVLDS